MLFLNLFPFLVRHPPHPPCTGIGQVDSFAFTQHCHQTSGCMSKAARIAAAAVGAVSGLSGMDGLAQDFTRIASHSPSRILKSTEGAPLCRYVSRVFRATFPYYQGGKRKLLNQAVEFLNNLVNRKSLFKSVNRFYQTQNSESR